MITRRGFFKAFGGAILGTAIALKLPDSIIAKVPTLDRTEPKYSLSYHQILHAHQMGCGDGIRRSLDDEPYYIMLSESVYRDTIERLLPALGIIQSHKPRLGIDSFKFLGATVYPSKSVSDEEMVLLGNHDRKDWKKRIIKIKDIDRKIDHRMTHMKKKFISLKKGKPVNEQSSALDVIKNLKKDV